MSIVPQTDFATVAEFKASGLPDKALINVETAVVQAALDRATGIMVGYFARYTLPLLEWDEGIKQCCIDLATRIVMRRRGFNPSSGADAVIEQGGIEAEKYLLNVSMQRINPRVRDSGAPANSVSAPQVQSRPPKGWGILGSPGVRRW